MTTPLLYDSHIHTYFCKHAIGNPESYVWKAWQQQLKGLVFACHNPMPDDFATSTRMTADELPAYRRTISELRENFAAISDVRLGLECDFLPQYADTVRKQIDANEYDCVLGSIHPFFREYTSACGTKPPRAAQEQYFDLLAQAAETGIFDVLAHPDIIKVMVPQQWDVETVMPAIKAALDRIAATDVAMELNTSGIHKAYPEFCPGTEILAQMHERNIPVVLGSDSHQPSRVGEGFTDALDQLRDIGYTHICHYLKRERQTVEIDQARTSLAGVSARPATDAPLSEPEEPAAAN